MIADRVAGAKYLPAELPQKPNLPAEPTICGQSYRKSQICQRSHIFADGAAEIFVNKNLPTEPQEPNLSLESQEPDLPLSCVACFIVCLFSNKICTSVPFLQTT
jgi:hypothetical protein